jgi:hypothetical protein
MKDIIRMNQLAGIITEGQARKMMQILNENELQNIPENHPLKKDMNIYNMKYIKLFESFKDIDSICKKYRIGGYTINSDGSVDVDGNVDLSQWDLTEIPLKFGKVSGDFDCYGNQLTTLEGAPKSVGGDLDCRYNQLTTLEGAPREVGRYLDCRSNPVHGIYKLFNTHEDFMDSLDWDYFRGNKIVKSRFGEACAEAGIEVPESIEGYEYI